MLKLTSQSKSRAANLDKTLARADQGQRGGEMVAQHGAYEGRAGVSDGEQDDSGRRADTLRQLGEIAILRDKRRRFRTRRIEDCKVGGFGGAKIAYLNTWLAELFSYPRCQGGGQVVVEPDRHSAAIRG